MEEIKSNSVDNADEKTIKDVTAKDKMPKAKFTGEADILTRATVGRQPNLMTLLGKVARQDLECLASTIWWSTHVGTPATSGCVASCHSILLRTR